MFQQLVYGLSSLTVSVDGDQNGSGGRTRCKTCMAVVIIQT